MNQNTPYKNIKYTHHKKIKNRQILARFLEFNCSGQKAVDIKIFYKIMRMSPLGLKNRQTLPKTTTTKTFTSKIQTKGRTLLICSKYKSINWEISTNFLMSSNRKQWKIPSKSFHKHFLKPQSSQIHSQFQILKSPNKTNWTFVNLSCLIFASKCTKKRLTWKILKLRKEPKKIQVSIES